jgi:Domain of unknown function (DUF4157)
MSQGPGHACAPVAAETVAPSSEQALAGNIREGFEAQLDHDLSDVRIHSGGVIGRVMDLLNARAMTIGNDIAFADGEFAPHTMRGRHLLAHELIHVVQQVPGRVAPGDGSGAPHEREAAHLSVPLAEGRAVEVRQVTGFGPAFALDDYIGRTPGPAEIERLELSQIEDDITEITEYLDRQIEGNETTAALEAARDRLIAQRQRLIGNVRADPEPRRRRRRGRRREQAEAEPEPTPDPAQMPRILRERTSIATEDSEEARREIDRIVAWLQRPDVDAADRQILRDELAVLAPQREQAQREEATARNAQRIQRLFQTSGDETEALRQRIRTVEAIYTDPGEPGVAFILHQGERHRISTERAQELTDTVGRELTRAAQRAARNANAAMSAYSDQSRINADQWIVSGIAGLLGGVDDPFLAMLSSKKRVDVRVGQVRGLLGRGDYSGAVTPMVEAAEAARNMERAVYIWRTGLIDGAGLAAGGLTFVRDASFAIATAIAAVVAAPVVAGVIGGTGVVASLGTIIGTGAVVGGGAGVVGGGSEYIGQRAAGASHEEASKAAMEQARRRAIEGGTAAIGGSTTRALGQVARVGTTANRQLLRRGVAEFGGDLLANTTGQVLQGESLGDALQTGGRQAGLGVIGTFAGGAARSPGLQNALEFGVNSLTTTADTLAQGGSSADVLQSLAISTATTGVLSRSRGFQEQQQRRFEAGEALGQRARGTVQSGVRRAQQFALAAGIGLADVPGVRSGHGGTSVQGTTLRSTPTFDSPTAQSGASTRHVAATQPGSTVRATTDTTSQAPPSSSISTPASTDASTAVSRVAAQTGVFNDAVQPGVSAGQSQQGTGHSTQAPQATQTSSTSQQAMRESTGARSTQRGISRHQDAIAEQERMGFLQPGTHSGAAASAQTARSITTGIRADVAEMTTYHSRLARGEIGILAPVGANIPGPDSATAVRLPNGDIEIVIIDTKARVSERSRFGRLRAALPATWSSAVSDALSPQRLNLGDPQLEAEIRDAWNQGRVRLARDTVDLSPSGQGDVRLDN